VCDPIAARSFLRELLRVSRFWISLFPDFLSFSNISQVTWRIFNCKPFVSQRQCHSPSCRGVSRRSYHPEVFDWSGRARHSSWRKRRRAGPARCAKLPRGRDRVFRATDWGRCECCRCRHATRLGKTCGWDVYSWTETVVAAEFVCLPSVTRTWLLCYWVRFLIVTFCCIEMDLAA